MGFTFSFIDPESFFSRFTSSFSFFILSNFMLMKSQITCFEKKSNGIVDNKLHIDYTIG